MTDGFDPVDMEAFDDDAKVGLLATVDSDGLPHVTLITTVQARTPTQLTWGQFCEGLSKRHVRHDPRTGFCIMTQDRRLWRGQATWTHAESDGPDFDLYNRKPMFRYNSYFGIHTVHFMDLVRTSGRESLSIPGLAAGTLATLAAMPRSGGPDTVLKPWARRHLASPATFKFLAWVRADGYPNVVPLVPTRVSGTRRLVFARTVYREELSHIPDGAAVAVFAMNMAAESVLVRGTFEGYRRRLGVPMGAVQLDWVYNTMPPKPGQVHPEQPIEPVRSFVVAS